MEPINAYCDESTSASADNIDGSYPSDCESGISGSTENRGRRNLASVGNGLIRVGEGEMIHGVIKKKLVSSLSSHGLNARVDSIRRIDQSTVMGRAKLQSFCIYSKAVEEKRQKGNSNLKYAWYGGSKDEVNSVLSHGFGLPLNSGAYGHGLYLSPADHPIESVESAVADENGLKHLLLCRVVMGRTEPVRCGSGQSNPSSEEFDSGVDDLACPNKYIVWASRMNTHVLPEFVVSFRTQSHVSKEFQKLPRSAWMPFPRLINVLTKFLPPDGIELIGRYHGNFKKKKISRQDMINLVRNIAGDKLLSAIIRSYRGREARRKCTE